MSNALKLSLGIGGACVAVAVGFNALAAATFAREQDADYVKPPLPEGCVEIQESQRATFVAQGYLVSDVYPLACK